MSARNFEELIGAIATPRPGFAERLGRVEPPPAATTEPAKEIAVGSGHYKAYGYLPANAEIQLETCDVQGWLDATAIAEGIEFSYRFLLSVGYIGDEELRVFLTDRVVRIEGRNLGELRKKLARRQVTFVQQFSPMVWPEEPLAGEPIVTQVEIAHPGEAKTNGKAS